MKRSEMLCYLTKIIRPSSEANPRHRIWSVSKSRGSVESSAKRKREAFEIQRRDAEAWSSYATKCYFYDDSEGAW